MHYNIQTIKRTFNAADIAMLAKAAQAENPWFSVESVRLAIEAIAEQMLAPEKLAAWLEKYPQPADFQPRNIGIVMAGNLPLVGFFDLLCICVSGHRACVKMSSKDTVLMSWAIEAMREAGAEIEPLTDDSPVDAVIATGSDNTNRYFSARYGSIPHLLRGSRTSVAVLAGDESDADLRGLSHDVFDHFGMGCRSVAKIFVPEDFPIERLMNALKQSDITHPNYRNAYRHHKAILQMRGVDFHDGGFFTLREGDGFSEALPDIIYTKYKAAAEVNEWIALNINKLQCIVRGMFGQAQRPELTDYPDGADVMEFLRNL